MVPQLDSPATPVQVITKTTLHSGALLLAYVITWQFIKPVQAYFFSLVESLALLIYLPFGIKVISAYFEGWRSLAYLAPGALLGVGLFTSLQLTSPLTYFTLLASYGAAPATFAILDKMIGCDRRVVGPHLGWRILLLGGLVTSIVSPVMIHLVRYWQLPSMDFAISLFKYIIGDIVGLVAVLFMLLALFRRTSTH